MADAHQIFYDPFLAKKLLEKVEKTQPSEEDQEIREWITSFLVSAQYEIVFVLDQKGLVRFAAPTPREENPSRFQSLFEKAKESEKVVFSDLYRDEESQRIAIDLLVPILHLTRGKTSVIGALLLRSDPYRVLYPLVQSWPTQSRTAEILLVRREKDEVVFLNELRHRKDAPFSLRVPVSHEDLPAAMVARGKEGIVEGRDYRGKSVLASVWAIPNSPWYLIAKMDEEEVFAPLRVHARFVIIIAALLVGASGVILGFLWRRQITQSRLREHEAEIQRQALIRHYGSLTKFANDIIFLISPDMRIVEVNDRAVELYGYSHEELLEMTVRDLRASEMLSSFDADFQRVESEEKSVFETLHKRKDDSVFPVEVSTRIIKVDGKRFHQAIIRDITERKRMEKEREKIISDLQDALSKVKALSGLLPICASCKKIRDDKGYWNQIESYIRDHSEADFSHGLCPDCLQKLYPEFCEDEKGEHGSDRGQDSG